MVTRSPLSLSWRCVSGCFSGGGFSLSHLADARRRLHPARFQKLQQIGLGISHLSADANISQRIPLPKSPQPERLWVNVENLSRFGCSEELWNFCCFTVAVSNHDNFLLPGSPTNRPGCRADPVLPGRPVNDSLLTITVLSSSVAPCQSKSERILPRSSPQQRFDENKSFTSPRSAPQRYRALVVQRNTRSRIQTARFQPVD